MEEWKELARRCRKEKFLIFLGCGKAKYYRKTKAKYLYTGTYFKQCFSVAKILTSEDHIYILSAKHGMISLQDEIEPYDLKLTDLSKNEKKQWNEKVTEQMKSLSDRKKIFICSVQYHKFFDGIKLLPTIGMGYQMQWMKNIINPKKKKEKKCLV